MRILLTCLDADRTASLEWLLDDYGYVVEKTDPVGEIDLTGRADPPDALVAVLDADPTEVLRQVTEASAAGRLGSVPVLFVGGTEADLVAAGACFPGASFCRADALVTSLASLKAG